MMRQFLVRVLVLALIVVGIRMLADTEPTVDCGGPSTSTPLVLRSIEVGASTGELFHDLITDGANPLEVMRLVQSIGDTIGRAAGVLGLGGETLMSRMDGRDEPTAATGWRLRTAKAQAAALASCCPQQATTGPQTPAPDDGSQAPFDPKQASLQTGPALAAAALRAAAPNDPKWLAQIPLGVAIASRESGFNPHAANSVSGGHVGFWQISGPNAAHLNLGDRTDPYANALYAHALWKGRGGTWAKDWTTYRSALPHAAEYARYAGGAQAVAGASGTVPSPTTATVPTAAEGCSKAGAGDMPNVRVGTWNVYVHNSPARVEQGVRALAARVDVMGLQEVSTAAFKQAAVRGAGPDFKWVAMGTSHPIGYRQTFTLTAHQSTPVFQRGTAMEGPDQGDRYVNSADLVTPTGAPLRVVDTHQLPKIQQGGVLNPAWPKRIRAALGIWRGVTTAVRGAAGPTVVVGDMNYTGDPDGLYAAAGLTAVTFPQPTSGRTRDIDKVLTTGGVASGATILPNFDSDHAPRVVALSGRPTPAQALGAAVSAGPVAAAAGTGRSGILAYARSVGAPANPHLSPEGYPSFDIMSSGALNTKIAEQMRVNHDAYRLHYVISQMRIASARSNWNWRPYRPITSQGDFRHVGHVHVSYDESAS